MKNVLIGYQLNEISELITHKKTWDSVDLAEKCFFAAVLFMIVFSLVATTIFTIWARRRMKGGFYITKLIFRNRESQNNQKRPRNRNYHETKLKPDLQ
jgi:hypothetical protein